MLVPVTGKDSEGYPYTKDGAEAVYVIAFRQKCILYFEKGEPLIYGYPLNYFHQKVYETNLFRRLDRSYLVKIGKVIKRRARKAILSSTLFLKLGRKANKKLKYYLAKFQQSSSVKK